jgi:hypothetical protein
VMSRMIGPSAVAAGLMGRLECGTETGLEGRISSGAKPGPEATDQPRWARRDAWGSGRRNAGRQRT